MTPHGYLRRVFNHDPRRLPEKVIVMGGEQMADRPYHRTRLGQFLVSAVIFLALIPIVALPWQWVLILATTGAVLGHFSGKLEWRKTEARVDVRNVIILYFSDTGLYGIFALLCLLSLLSPFAIFHLFRFVDSYWSSFQALLLSAAASWGGHNLAFYRGVKEFESTHGRLRVKRFYARSVTGPQGMISKNGTVLEACKPIGRSRWEPKYGTPNRLTGR